MFELDSTFTNTYSWLGLAQLFLGDADSAVRTAEKGLRLSRRPGNPARLLLAYAGAGRRAEADRMRAEIARPEAVGASHYDGALSAIVYGDLDAATAALEQSLIRGDLFVVVFSPGCDPQLDPLKREARFVALMQRYGMRICPATTPWPIKPRPRSR